MRSGPANIPSLRFSIASEISVSDRATLFDWGPDIFNGAQYNLKWRGPDLHVIGTFDRRPVTHVGIVKHEVTVGGRGIVVGGIGAVVTVSESQKKGFARECLLRAQAYMRAELGVKFGFLFCPQRLLAYYGAAGWRKLDETVLIDQPSGEIAAPLCAMVLEFSDSWPSGTVRLRSFPW